MTDFDQTKRTYMIAYKPVHNIDSSSNLSLDGTIKLFQTNRALISQSSLVVYFTDQREDDVMWLT